MAILSVPVGAAGVSDVRASDWTVLPAEISAIWSIRAYLVSSEMVARTSFICALSAEPLARPIATPVPAVQSGAVDAIVAGMSPTPDREEKVDFTDMYYVSNLVIIYKKK